jgi:hypothetical protein
MAKDDEINDLDGDLTSWMREGFDPPDGSQDRGEWQVHFGALSGEDDVLRDAAKRVLPAERVDVYTEDADGALDVVVAIRVVASSREDATREATYQYRRVRSEAALEVGAPLVLGYISPSWRARQLPDRLSREAHTLHKYKRFELAVIRIQTACELLLLETFKSLLKSDGDTQSFNALRRPITLRENPAKALLEELTGRRIQDAGWWPQYVEHLKRRNAVVHSGLFLTWEDSHASLEAHINLHRWLLEAQGDDLTDLEGSV